MNSGQVRAMMKKYESESHDSEEPNGFLVGLTLMASLARKKHDGMYGAEHDLFWAYNPEELDGLTEEHVRGLVRLGWHLCSETDCIAHFI